LATRSLSKLPSGLPASPLFRGSISPLNKVPSSFAFLISETEYLSISLTPLDYAFDYDPLIPRKSNKSNNPDLSTTSNSNVNLKSSCTVNNATVITPTNLDSGDSIHLLCPAVVTVGTLHHLLLAKYQLDPVRQVMEAEVGRTQAALLLYEFECCARCIRRMLYGATSQPADFLHLADAERETPICPICCGVLHHPRLCTLPADYDRSKYQPAENEAERYMLAEMLYKMDASDFEYLACQFKITEPINHLLREHIMWSRLHDLVTGMKLDSYADPVWRNTHPPGQITCLFTTKDLQRWQRTRIAERQVWYWIVSHILSAAIEVPAISQLVEVHNPAFLKSNNLDPTLCDPETVVLAASAVLSDTQSREELEQFLQSADRCPIGSIRNHANEMLKQIRAKRKSYSPNGNVLSPDPNPFELGRGRMVQFLSELWNRSTCLCLSLHSKPNLPKWGDIKLQRVVPIVLAGRYVKFSRRLPHTPWIIDSKRKLPSSVEELILNPLRAQFGSGSQLSFSSAGREDVDARCLGLGRPFMVRISYFEAFFPDLVRSFSIRAQQSKTTGPVDLLRLASLINTQGEGKVLVRDLQIVSSVDATKTIKCGELKKSKHYRALCWCPGGGLTTELIQRVAEQCNQFSPTSKPRNTSDLVWPPQSVQSDPDKNEASTATRPSYPRIVFGPLEVCQLTPIRVLHRRALLDRPRVIKSFELASFEQVMSNPDMDLKDYEPWQKLYPINELFILHVHCDAGSYVKEFVHGDLGRCTPSLSSLVGRQLDLLALDVCGIDFDWPPILPDPEPPIQPTNV
uniref:tRNA pseudouridine(55) synthase n=1 Tax=Echinostoma caproni TaxID=27848 RepID=A0A183AES5_9TREM